MTDEEIMSKLKEEIVKERAIEYVKPKVVNKEIKGSLQMAVILLDKICEVGFLEINEVIKSINEMCKPGCEFQNEFDRAIKDAAEKYVTFERVGIITRPADRV